MKCAKCGHDVDPASPECPYCASGAAGAEPRGTFRGRGRERVRCPRCGSEELDVVRRDFDPGCGCLGLLLFGWVGVLLGLLGGGDAEIVCRNCGTKWPPGNPGGARRGGCLGLLLVSIMIILALSFLGRSR